MPTRIDLPDKPAPSQDDLATAILRFIDQGEGLAVRCHADGYIYLGSVILAGMRRLEDAARHESATRGDRPRPSGELAHMPRGGPRDKGEPAT